MPKRVQNGSYCNQANLACKAIVFHHNSNTFTMECHVLHGHVDSAVWRGHINDIGVACNLFHTLNKWQLNQYVDKAVHEPQSSKMQYWFRLHHRLMYILLTLMVM